MSQIAPDIPELEHLPETVRSLVWMRAMMRAVRSPATWLAGLMCFAVIVGAGIFIGLRALGWTGAVIGGLLGTGITVWAFFRILIQWQARRLLPAVEKEIDWNSEFGDVIRAEDRISRVIAASKERVRDE